MQLTENTEKYIKKAFWGKESALRETDPEFYQLFADFAFDEVKNGVSLDEKTALMSMLAALLGCGGTEAFKFMLPAALSCGVTAEEAREIVYQATAYLGAGRVLPFLYAMNEVFLSCGISLPLENAATTNKDNRLAAGNDIQIKIFGEGMRGFWKNAPEGRERINYWLADNCFGDYYTRGVLDIRQREMITFCFLYAFGGCESQLISHAAGNMRVGNDKKFLYDIVSFNVPYIGYPRSLNALSAIDAAEKNISR